MVTFPRTL
jgi:hypothetical protein